MNILPEMLTPKEVAKILKISYESALGFINYSGIDYIRVGNQCRVSAEKLKAFLPGRARPLIGNL